jgi:hypothetical protein
MDTRDKKVVDRFLEEYTMDLEGDIAIETAKFLLDQIVTGEEFKEIVLRLAKEETGEDELAETVYATLIQDVWPRIAKDLPRIV